MSQELDPIDGWARGMEALVSLGEDSEKKEERVTQIFVASWREHYNKNPDAPDNPELRAQLLQEARDRVYGPGE